MKTRAIERYLVVARRGGASPVVVRTNRTCRKTWPRTWLKRRWWLATSRCSPSARTPARKFEQLTGVAFGQTVALLARRRRSRPSSIGSSDAKCCRREVRAGSARRHTTVHRRLVVRAEGGLIGTPGMRELQLWDTDAVTETFADIAAFAESCRFRDCQHDREPGCAVKEAVERGDLDAARYQRFLKLQAEQALVKQARRARADRSQTRRQDARAYRLWSRAANVGR